MRAFNYTPDSPIRNSLTTIGISLVMILLPIYSPFGLRIGSLRVFSPAVFSTIMIIGGIALLIFTISDIRKARALAKNGGGKITVDGDQVTWPDIKKGTVVYKEFLISEIEKVKYDEENQQLDIVLPYEYISLEIDHFDSMEEFQVFKGLLLQSV